MDKNYKLYTDGGARGNPGPAGLGYVIFDGEKVIDFGAEFIPHATNNQAEYMALEKGLMLSKKAGVKDLLCYLDSELVVKQLQGEYKVKNANMKPLFDKITSLIAGFDSVTFTHVPRAENSFADKLVNIALDAKLS